MEPTDNKLLPQNFLVGIILSCLSIIQLFYDCWLRYNGERINSEHHKYLFLINTILGVWIILFERKYLKNFSSKNAIKWLDLSITLILLMFIFILITPYYHKLNTTIRIVIGFIDFLLLILYCYCSVRLGNSIRLIQDDFIGLLKGLGFSIIISSLYYVMAGIIVAFHIHSNLITTLTYIVNIPPLVILIIVYSRALASTKTTNTVRPE